MVKAMTKNMYFIVMKYLKHNEIFTLVLSNKSIYQRVSKDDYFEKLVTSSYLQFFNSQFSIHQLPFECFIKQRSNCGRGLGYTDTDTTRDDSDKASSFEGSPVPEETCRNPLWRKNLVGLDEEMEDVSQPRIFSKIHVIYRQLADMKNKFIAHNSEAFAALSLPSSVKNFAREMLLEANQCENLGYMLPPLQRDSASRKGIHYLTEKMIVCHYNNCFPFMNSTKIRD